MKYANYIHKLPSTGKFVIAHYDKQKNHWVSFDSRPHVGGTAVAKTLDGLAKLVYSYGLRGTAERKIGKFYDLAVLEEEEKAVVIPHQ